MKSLNVRFITRTAVILALVIVFQSLGRFIPLGPNSNFVVGPLVNACLLIATAFIGLAGGTIIAILSPFMAILTGAAVPLPFAPFIAGGNFLIVLMFYLIKNNQLAGVLVGSLLKCAFLYASINFFVWFMGIPSKKAAAMLLAFGWPQLVTALIGGIVALIVIKALKKYVKIERVIQP